jgi:hypothetical protein
MDAAGQSYEQSQFRAPSQPGADCQTNPIWRCILADRERLCQTNPIWGSPGGARRPILPNKANSGSRPRVPRSEMRQTNPIPAPYADPEIGVPGRGKCVKQTQTWASWGIWIMRRGTRGKCAKRTQFPDGTGRPPRLDPPASAAPSGSCKTKPISTPSGRSNGLESAAVCRPHPPTARLRGGVDVLRRESTMHFLGIDDQKWIPWAASCKSEHWARSRPM